jgi:hypothetical protein
MEAIKDHLCRVEREVYDASRPGFRTVELTINPTGLVVFYADGYLSFRRRRKPQIL